MAWLQLPQTPVKRAVFGALLISTIVGVLHVFACWFSVAPHGSDYLYNKISGMLVIYLFLVVLYNVVRITFAVVGRLFGVGKVGWPQLAGGAIFCGIVFVITLIAFGVGETMRDAGFKAITVRGRPLVAAIKQFQAKNGAPPGGLDELVPDFIPAIPDTGVGAYPKYEYLRQPDPVKYGGNPWVLFVNVSTDDQMQDLLIFYPNQNYPSRQQVASVRRFGDWAKISTPNPSNAN
ncbi:MAG: hypothetical protein ABSH15_16260 [Verrucomicrobiota bacterium]|jgi:hypothetical protein